VAQSCPAQPRHADLRLWPGDALRTEHFVSTAGALDPAKEHAFEVQLKDSGFVVSVAADQTLLAALRSPNAGGLFKNRTSVTSFPGSTRSL